MNFETATSLGNGLMTAAAVGLGEIVARRNAPTTDWTDVARGEHFVQFYSSDEYIINAVSEYLIHGLKSNETCIVAATGEHLADIERLIEDFGGDLPAARREGRYIAIDARETLSKFMIDGMPDAALFDKVVGKIVATAAERGVGIRAFGEMVGVLCASGNYAGALQLEDLWNRLRKKYPFSLFCAYPMSSLKTSAAGASMAHICSGHSRVIPDESYTSLGSSDERLRAIAVLQQKNYQLHAELAEMESRLAMRQVPQA